MKGKEKLKILTKKLDFFQICFKLAVDQKMTQSVITSFICEM